jgi:hypothetical protein
MRTILSVFWNGKHEKEFLVDLVKEKLRRKEETDGIETKSRKRTKNIQECSTRHTKEQGRIKTASHTAYRSVSYRYRKELMSGWMPATD